MGRFKIVKRVFVIFRGYIVNHWNRLPSPPKKNSVPTGWNTACPYPKPKKIIKVFKSKNCWLLRFQFSNSKTYTYSCLFIQNARSVHGD